MMKSNIISRQITTRVGIFGLMGLLATTVIGCGLRESATGNTGGASRWRERNTELPATSLVNGSFTLGGGGWTSNGFPLAKGCQEGGGDPSLGGWKEDALTFGYSRQTVLQSVRILNPATVVLRLFGAVRADQSSSTFNVTLSGAGQSVSTGPQSGYELTIPKEFTLSLTTRLPGELIDIAIEGSSASFWAGCYGPIITQARLDIVGGAVPSISTIAPDQTTTTGVQQTSTIVAVVPTTSAPAMNSTSAASSSTATNASSVSTSVAASVPATTTTSAPPAVVSGSAIRGDGSCEFGASKACADVDLRYFVGEKKLREIKYNFNDWRASGSDFSGWDFARVDLSSADLHLSNLSNVNLSAALLDGANLVGANLTLTQSRAATAAQGLGQAQLKRADLSLADLTNSNLAANFEGAKLIGANLSGADLSDSDLTRADLRGAQLHALRTVGIRGKDLRLPGGFIVARDRIVGPGVDLSARSHIEWIKNRLPTAESVTGPSKTVSCDARPHDFGSGWYERGSNDFKRFSFAGMDLTEVDFSGLNLEGADFSRTKLSRAKFVGANLSGARFIGASVDEVDLSGALISGVDFTSAAKFGAVRSGLTMLNPGASVSLPRGWTFVPSIARVDVCPAADKNIVVQGFILGPTAVLPFADLTGLNLNGIDLSDAVLHGVRATRNQHSRTRLPSGYGWVGDILVGPDVDLANVVINGGDFLGIDLSNANLTQAQLTGVRGAPLLPTGYRNIAGVVVGPNLYLRKLKFSGADLRGIDISGSFLDGVDLSQADLTGVRSGGVRDGQGSTASKTALPAGYAFIGGYLMGPRVDLTRSTIDGVYIPPGSNIDLTSATLTGSKWQNLRGYFRFTLPSGWAIGPSGQLFGPTAELAGTTGDAYRMNTRNFVVPPAYRVVEDRLFGPGLTRAWTSGPSAGSLSDVDISDTAVDSSLFDTIRLERIRGTRVIDVGKKLKGRKTAWEVTPRGTIVGPSANLRDVDLSGDLISVRDLSRADLTNVHGVNVRLGSGISIRLPDRWRFERGLIIGPSADLSGANLTGLTLNDDLSGATLTNAYGTNILGSPILPQGWLIVRGALVGPTANMICGDLKKSDLPAEFKASRRLFFDAEAMGVEPLLKPLC